MAAASPTCCESEWRRRSTSHRTPPTSAAGRQRNVSITVPVMAIITARKISTSRFDMVHIVATSSLEATSKPVSPALPCGSPSPPSHRTSSTPRGSTLRRNLEGTGLPPHHCFLGPLGHVTLRGDCATAPLQHICNFRFSCFVWPIRFSKGTANAAHRSGFGNSGSLAAAR